MSTTDAGRFATDRTHTSANTPDINGWAAVRSLLLPLASLRLTVVLFGLSIILVFAGTLAQREHEIWYVVKNYFRCWLAWIEFQDFFPLAMEISGGLWFPGGKLVGAAMGINLLAAHTLRFRITAKGNALWSGLGLIATGVVLTWLVIQSGLDDTVESELSPAFCNGLWHALRFALGAGVLGFAYYLALSRQTIAQAAPEAAWRLLVLWRAAAVFCALLGALAVWLFLNPDAKLDASGLRILWQLIKSTGAGVVLLLGCYQLFGKRAGIVLLHGGIALLMFSELWTSEFAQESQMRIAEGQTVDFSTDHRSAELAVVDKSDKENDQVTVVPLELLLGQAKEGQTFDDSALPFLVRVVNYHQNATTRFLQPGETPTTTHGVGKLRVAEELPINTGVGEAQGVDMPAMVVELTERKGGSSLGTFLLSPTLFEETLQIDGIPYEVSLRFKRIQKPYALRLDDFLFDRYTGTETAKNFSSTVTLADDQHNVDRQVTISMNNPLRYYGDTLYQADWDKETERGTVLQVTTNSGWMIPYVSCMLVAIGMFAQFGTTFWRFARREAAPVQAASGMSFGELLSNWTSPKVWIPAAILALWVAYVIGGARSPQSPATEMQIHKFGELPVAYNGRVKPIDTLARNALTVMSDKATFEIDDPAYASKTLKKSAVYWLLELLAEKPDSRNHRVFRIDDLDVLQTLDLKPREGFRYSLDEVVSKTFKSVDRSGAAIDVPEALRQARLASEVPKDQRDKTQLSFLELGTKLNIFGRLREAFSSPRIRLDSLDLAKEDLARVQLQIRSLKTGSPRIVPPSEPTETWRTMLEAEHDAFRDRINGKEPDDATIAVREIIEAYAADDVTKFNDELASYRGIIAERAERDRIYEVKLAAAGEVDGRKEAEKLRLERVEFEAFFNHFNPFKKALVLYIIAFVLAAVSWLGWSVVLNRSANWLLWFTFALHTYALVCRIYISGRPPVTNLYSSAVFIGWAAVLFALLFERVYRFGIGNLLAAAVGFPTLLVAYYLAGDGDTFQVLQAVLDTQFWLATHVVCITLGYSTTLLAGVLGLAYVLLGHVGGQLDDTQRNQLIRMTYGTLCFATFFSFVGTVLGGLWADDSWGRFWGWDPKENGALIIVIWNALVLHARWGAMVRQRGMAVLAIFGNVVTAWSWFGVNQMSVGLHAYGFRDGMTRWLCIFVGSQLFVMLLGCVSADWWRGKEASPPTPQEA